MSYVTRHLMPGETVVRETHLSRIVYLPALVLLVLAGLLLWVVERGASDNRSALLVPAGFLAGAVVLMFWGFVKVSASEFAVTNKRVIVKIGLLRRHSSEILLRQVEGITVDQGLLGRIFNYGTIVIEGTGSDRTPYPGIGGPLQFRLAVQEQIDKCLTPPGFAAPAAAPADRYDTLARLQDLRAKGALSEEEFEREKRRVLGPPVT